MDSDEHINILIYDIDYDSTPAQSGGVYGYFWGKDWFTNAETEAWTPPLSSNESEIFYVDSRFLDEYPDSMYSTLAHELQHMIHYNRKALNGGYFSETWYNEMLSMLTEDIMQNKLGILDYDSPKGRTYDFVDGYYLSGVTEWLSGADVFYSYASSFMFGAFLTRNFGGAGLIKAMIDSNSVNQQSVTDALIAVGYSTETFDSVFNQYQTSLIYSTEDLTQNIRVTNRTSIETINSTEYTQSAFDIYDYINLATSSDGPVWFPLDERMELRPRGMSIHSDNSWMDLSGTKTLNFNIVAPDTGVKYYVMFK